MKALALWAGLGLVAGLVVGAGLGLRAVNQPGIGISTADGLWTTDPLVGAQSADPLLRARIARSGLFALSREEAVYYVRTLDQDRRPFDPDCTYRISGGAAPAGWWSVTLYAEDYFLAENTDAAHSVNADLFADETWSAVIGPDRPTEVDAWISTRNAGRFDLLFRLYEPDLDSLGAASADVFPRVDRLACPGDAA